MRDFLDSKLGGWQPFRIDALGLVTLLGAEEVNAALGRLVPSRYFEYFPLLGAYVIAGDRFKDKRPSFQLYNITAGINTSDLSSWLTRWMIAQQFDKNRSIVHFQVEPQPRSERIKRRAWGIVPCVLLLGLLILCIITGDGYGTANAIAMIVSVITRTYILGANRKAIDNTVIQKHTDSGFLDPKDHSILDREVKEDKCMVIMSDSKAVTIYAPGHLLVPVLVYNPEPAHPAVYHAVRWIGWLAFVVHVLSIGGAYLAFQIFSVLLVVIPTVLIHWKTGCEDSQWAVKWGRVRGRDRVAKYECWIGTMLKATVFEWPLDTEFTKRQELAVPLYEMQNTPQPHTAVDIDHDPSMYASNTMTSDNSNPISWYRVGRGRKLTLDDRANRRMDLYARLNFTADEEESMSKWDLFPHMRGDRMSIWWEDYKAKRQLIDDNPPRLDDMKARTVISRKGTIMEEEYAAAAPVELAEIGRSPAMANFQMGPIQQGIRRAPTETVLTAGGTIRET